jgi:hypothetical protein
VLEEAKHRPPCIPQRVVGFPVSLDIPGQLRLPIPPIDLRELSVIGALMPEATVDKYGDPSPRKGDVWTHPAFLEPQ